MSRLIFMLEERSIKVLLDILLPRLFPDLEFLCVSHDGKSDLERSLPKKLKAWQTPEDKFVVVRDNDGGDCKRLKTALLTVCKDAGCGDALIRIICHELEAWYFGDPAAMAEAFGNDRLGRIGKRAKFRDPDAIMKPSLELNKIHPQFQKIDGARRMAPLLTPVGNRSRSFHVFIDGVERLARPA